VLYTRGSVIPYFIERIKNGKAITVTDPRMTRFFMTIEESLDLVLFALTSGRPGEIYVRKAPAANVADLATAVAEVFSYTKPIENIGARPGERTDEFLISCEEGPRAIDHGDYYSITPETKTQEFPASYFEIERGKKAEISDDGYSSANTTLLSKDEVKKMLLALPEVQAELATYQK
jgi:UDP-glucose 4-epimerase